MMSIITRIKKGFSTIHKVLPWCSPNDYQSRDDFASNRKRMIDPTVVFQFILLLALVGLMTIFSATLYLPETEDYVKSLLGLQEKHDVITFLGIGMGGILVALQALMSYKRAKAMEDVARAQASANKNTELGQRQERMRSAIEHLGHKSSSVRLGGAYELFHLAQDNENLRETVLDILCAHIRRTTRSSSYQKTYKSKPSEEIQSLVNLLFVKEHEIFNRYRADLQGCWLNGIELARARLNGANLNRVRLHKSSLPDADLSDTLLMEAQLQEAYMVAADLRESALLYATLQVANLGRVRMQGADITGAQMQASNLAFVQFQGANLIHAQLQGAHLLDTDMRGATCEDEDDIYTPRILQFIGIESDMSSVTFGGGLTADRMQSLMTHLSSDGKDELEGKTVSHIGKEEINQPPDGVITGSYTAEEAESWLTED